LPITAGTTMPGRLFGIRRAMSEAGSLPASVAGTSVPSAKVISMRRAPSTTWNAVTTSPSALATTPVPLPAPSTLTTDGASAA
jgi:hypothetical protein